MRNVVERVLGAPAKKAFEAERKEFVVRDQLLLEPVLV